MKKRTLNCLFMLVVSASILMLQLPDTAQAYKIERKYYEKKGLVIWDVPSPQKEVAITFDDGPNPLYTPAILDVLKKYHAKATFFVVGKHIIRNPEIVKREIREGHELGDHTYTHPHNFSYASKRLFAKEVTKTEKLIEKVQKNEVKLFRPPGGNLNKQIIKYSNKKGYKIILWSWHQDPKDWRNPGAGSISRHILSNVKNGDIILLHDSGGNRRQTIEALKIVLPELQKRGFKCVTVSELLQNDPKFTPLFPAQLEPFKLFDAPS
ncbi:polysaccharide deacetylase family protein [Fictibacillus sp. S7]|uniref:polysaccharide deacetylase family protein n=1 Tax=Fictibacillus sp. S7 TaxID=2212476 RepID=UPI00101175C2|nr:polysaccharide deacetylase family protein [Fictibacillus sp. S7]RXY99769.1 chitooligosaccharide deacetylase [Fictibacillus sp. S7]